jgi:hypothetical protein
MLMLFFGTLAWSKKTTAQEFRAVPTGRGDFIVVPLNPQRRPIRVIPPNRGPLLSIPNRRYVTVPPRSRGGGGARYSPSGKPGVIQTNPFVVPPKPEVKIKVDTIEERERKGMAWLEYSARRSYAER